MPKRSEVPSGLKYMTYKDAFLKGYTKGFVYWNDYREEVTFSCYNNTIGKTWTAITDRFGKLHFVEAEKEWVYIGEPAETKDTPQLPSKAQASRLTEVRQALLSVVRVMMSGEAKHPTNDWFDKGAKRHLDAAIRHVLAAGTPDEESGEEHAAHAVCRLLYYLEIKLKEAATDEETRKSTAPK